MRVASFNMQNVFHRNSNLVKRSLSESVNMWVEEFERLLCKPYRGNLEIARMRELSFLLGFHKADFEPYVVMRRRAGELFLRKKNFKREYKAVPLNGWNGWIKLNSNPITEESIRNKARVIMDINPDVLLLQEVEDRQSLIDFNQYYLNDKARFSQVLLLSGNDQTGRDLGVMTKNGYEILRVRSYANTEINGQKLFDKDLQEYEIQTPKGKKFYVLSVHLEDHTGNKDIGKTRRRMQANKVAQVYKQLKEEQKQVIVAGTFNQVSFCESIAPILRETDLRDLKCHRNFFVEVDDGKDGEYYSLGAYRMGVNMKQMDYMLASPEIFRKIRKSGLHRRGVFPSKKGQWSCYETLESQAHQASAHPALWMDL